MVYTAPAMLPDYLCPRCRGGFSAPPNWDGRTRLGCPRCSVALLQLQRPAPSQAPSFPWGKALGTALSALFVYKVFVQPLLDEEYPTRTLPRNVRERLKDEHIAAHGSVCLECGCRTARHDLVIDHIVAYAYGGRTSLENSQVLCLWCNLEKSARVTMLDSLRGRGGRAA